MNNSEKHVLINKFQEYLDAAGYTQNFPYHDTKYSSAIDADTDLYWDMNNAEGATAGHPTIVQHIAATFVYGFPELTRKWSGAYDIKRADQAIFTNAKNATTGHFYDPIVNYMNQWPTYFDEDSFTASEVAMMKWGAWEFLEGYATPSRNGHQSVFVGVSSTISKSLLITNKTNFNFFFVTNKWIFPSNISHLRH